MSDLKYLNLRPIYGIPSDELLFVKREKELEATEFGLKNEYNIIIKGRRADGKTTILHKVEAMVKGMEGFYSVFIDLGHTNSIESVFDQIRISLLEHSGTRNIKGLSDKLQGYQQRFSMYDHNLMAEPDVQEDRKQVFIRQLLQTLKEETGSRPYFILDNLYYNPQLLFNLFGIQRDILWNWDCRFCISCDENAFAEINKPPFSTFFDQVISLEAFSESELIALLGKRGITDEDLIEKLSYFMGGSPGRAIVLIKKVLLSNIERKKQLKVLEQFHQLLAELSSVEERVLQYIISNETTSASDGQLQKTFNISRSRLTQILLSLKKKKLVESFQSHQKVLYRIHSEIIPN